MAGRQIDVTGARVLVTAGASGIGRAIAEAFVSGGARVHVTDIDEAAIAAFVTAQPGVSATAGDAADAAHADRALADVQARLGGLDVLVNNVGVAGPTGRVEDYDEDDVERAIEVNLTAHFRFLKRFTPLLRQSTNNPCILAMSSVAGRLGYGYRTPYAATKWAIVGLVKSLAIELGPQGVRANAIMPGIVRGPRIDRVIAARAETEGVSVEAMEAAYIAKISMRRMVEAEDIADLALFLASDMARNISGQAISVDGHVEYL